MSSLIYLFLANLLLILCQLQPLWAAPGADDPLPPRSSGDIAIEKLTDEDRKTLVTTGRLSIVPVGEGIYVPGPIKFPCGQTWASWWKQNYWYFQCIANKNCKPYFGCWCNLCACYTFVVYPQNPPCRPWISWDRDLLAATSIRASAYIYADDTGEKAPQ